jgi:hypothetical protein
MPSSAPRHPAWAAATTPALPSRKSTGWQSAVRIAMASPGVAVTMASAVIGSVAGAESVTARAVWAWCTVTSRSVGTSIARATRSRFVATMADWSDDPPPQFRPSKMPDDAPPRRVKKPCLTSPRSGEVMISRLAVTAGIGVGRASSASCVESRRRGPAVRE